MSEVTITYYRKTVYGNELEYLSSEGDQQLVTMLTGQKTINAKIREAIHDLSRGLVSFKEVMQP